MFKRILLPTDGSETSAKAIQSCISFAKETGATIIGLHVIPEFHTFTYQTEMLEDTRAEYERKCMAHVKKYLAEIEIAAKAADVQCETSYMISESPYEAIIKAAKDKRCELIAMASHGRKGMKGFLLGSETQKVLTNSQIPVLVFR
ncbi:MAG: universal stress protein [Pseudomonadota bacterium]